MNLLWMSSIFFKLSETEAEAIKNEVLANVSQWETIATEICISRSEQKLMEPAFNV
jgi:serine/threonine-protein kinase HipA